MIIKIEDAIAKSIDSIQEASNKGWCGVPSGFKDLDRVLCGFENSDLVVVGARPAMGKTGFILSLVINIVKQDLPVLFYSLEMSSEQIIKRLMSNLTDIEIEKMRTGMLSYEDWDAMNIATGRLYRYPLILSDKNSWNIEDFCNEVKKDTKVTDAKIVFIDYLQLFSTRERLQNRYEEIAYCTRMLKKLARELNIPIVVTSQLNRSVENRNGYGEEKLPQMFDLRDSGTICEDANVVLLLYRPEYYLKSGEDDQGNDIRGLAEVIIAKNHMGSPATIKLKFISKIGRFDNWNEFSSDVFETVSNFEQSDSSDVPF